MCLKNVCSKTMQEKTELNPKRERPRVAGKVQPSTNPTVQLNCLPRTNLLARLTQPKRAKGLWQGRQASGVSSTNKQVPCCFLCQPDVSRMQVVR